MDPIQLECNCIMLCTPTFSYLVSFQITQHYDLLCIDSGNMKQYEQRIMLHDDYTRNNKKRGLCQAAFENFFEENFKAVLIITSS